MQEVCDARGLVVLADAVRRLSEREEGREEAAVGQVGHRNRALAAPTCSAKRVQPAVVAHPSEGVAGDGVASRGAIGQFRSGQQGPRETRCGVLRRGLPQGVWIDRVLEEHLD